MIKITKNLVEADYVTHAGNFHADDVFSTVFLEKLFDDITVIRLSEYQNDGTKIAYDIGGGEFDHHQKGFAKTRSDGIHYCGFGLLWQRYGQEYLKKINVTNIKDTYKVFDYLLVHAIDAIDNGEFSISSAFNVYTISSLITLFRPKESNSNEDECFIEATKFASIIFDLIMNDAISKVQNIEKIEHLIPTIKDEILILDEYIPYEFALFYLKVDNQVSFIIYPSNRGGYAAHTLSDKYGGYTPKIPFLKEWAGLRNEELQKKSGVKTAKFCHNNLFIATAETKEDALLLATKTIDKIEHF